jgi:hypothetical protein
MQGARKISTVMDSRNAGFGMEKRPRVGRCISGCENSHDKRSESPSAAEMASISIGRSDDGPCVRIYSEGPSQIGFTKQSRILSLAQFWQHACPVIFALQQQLRLAKKAEGFIDSKNV